MKKKLLFVAVLFVAVAGQAALLTEGTSELAVSGLWDFKTVNNRLLSGEISYGYFIMDQVQVGGYGAYEDDDMHRTWGVGVKGEYNLDMSYLEIIPEIVPFAGVSMGVAGTSYDVSLSTPRAVYDTQTKQAFVVYDQEDESDSNTGLNLGLEAGVKFFITDNLAISTSLSFDMCTGAIYPDDRDLKKTDTRLNVGMRYYF